MKKKAVKKLQLSRETLQALTASDCQKVAGALLPTSCESGENCCCVDTQSKACA
jgi:predicted DNA-binding protein (UPF0251 family)